MNSLYDYPNQLELIAKVKTEESKASRCGRCGDFLPSSNPDFGSVPLPEHYPDVKSWNNNNDKTLCVHCSQLKPQFAHQESVIVKSEFLGSYTPPDSNCMNGEDHGVQFKIEREAYSETQLPHSNCHYRTDTKNTGSIDSPPVSIVLPNGLDIRHPDNIPSSTLPDLDRTPYSCLLCSKSFKNHRVADAHQDKHHSKLARYTCDTCHGKFCYRGTLNSHVASHHPHLPSYDCSTCGKNFREKSNLSAHTTIVHALNTRVFKCEYCVSAFSKKVNLNYHRKRKHPDQIPPKVPLILPLLPVVLRMEGNNNGHGTVSHQGNLKTLSVPSLLQVELREPNYGSNAATASVPASEPEKEQKDEGGKKGGAAGGRAEGDFKCQFCGRGFLFRNNLKCHLRTHIRDKKYTCTVCEKSFIYKESLKNHMLLHSNELPYQCDICMKKFRDRSNRRKHVKNVHKSLLLAGSTVTSSQVLSTGTVDRTGAQSQPKRQRRRATTPRSKKAEVIPLPTTTPSPPMLKGPLSQPDSPVYPTIKAEVLSPLSQPHHDTYQDQTPLHHHYQHPPQMTQVKTEPSDHRPYYDYDQQHQHPVEMGQYPMPSPQSMSPNGNNTGPTYESPRSPYVVNMSMVQPPAATRLENVSSVPTHSTTHLQHLQQPYSPSLYSSPMMSMGESYQPPYWTTPPTQSDSPRPYYHPTVTERPALNPPPTMTYDPTAVAAQAQPQPHQAQAQQPQQGSSSTQTQHNYFYIDLAQFDLSHL